MRGESKRVECQGFCIALCCVGIKGGWIVYTGAYVDKGTQKAFGAKLKYLTRVVMAL